MSDEHHDHHERGAHEIDKLPSGRLFNLLFGLSLLTLLASIGVVQLFNLQVEDIQDSRARAGSYRLQEYREEVQQVLSGYGQLTVTEDGGAQTQRYYIPVDEAKKNLLENPELLGASGKYRGWESSGPGKAVSEVETAAKKAMPPVPPPGAVPVGAEGEGEAPPEGEPAGERPEQPSDEGADDEGAGDARPGDKPPEQEPAKPEKPAEDKPAKPTGDKPTGDKPTGDKPTGDKPTGDKPTKPSGDTPAKPTKPTKPSGKKPKDDDQP